MPRARLSLAPLVLALALLAALPTRSEAAAYAFAPVADGYVRSDAPRTSFGGRRLLSAMRAPRQVRRAYLRFSVRVPAGQTITRATLRLYARSRGTRAGVELRGVRIDSWRQSALSWRRAPAFGPAVARARRYADRSWVSLDATALVRGPGLASMALVSRAPSWQGFASREDPKHPPRLIVRTAAVPGGPGHTGLAGAPPAVDGQPTAASLPLPTGGGGVLASPPPTGPGLHSTPTQAFVDASGQQVLLKGFNVVPVWRGNPGSTWDASRYLQIKAKGFDAVRFVLYWRDFEPQRGVFNQTSLATLDTAIARAKAAGLYVILDEIHLWGSGGFQDVPGWAQIGDSVATIQANGGGFVTMLAARYRDEPAVAGYDLVNEPYRTPIDQNGVLSMYDALIRQVRAVDPDKIILLEPSYGDTSIAGSLADFSRLSDKRNVVWQLHDYFAGGDDDGYRSDGAQTGTYVWDGATGYANPNPAQLEAHLLVHLQKAAQVGLPVWIGEFGIGNGAVNRDRWIADQVALFRRYGLGYAWWEYHTTEAFSATDTNFSWQPWVDLLAG
jgi:hypothetical protein